MLTHQRPSAEHRDLRGLLDFSSGNLEGWSQYLAPTGQPGDFSLVDGECRLESGPSVVPTVWPASIGLYRSDLDWRDFDISMDFTGWHLGTGHQTNSAIVLAARSTVQADNRVRGLALFVLPERSPLAGNWASAAGIFVNVVHSTEPLSEFRAGYTILDESVFDPDVWYRLTFSGRGEQIEAALYRRDNLSVPLGTLSARDTTSTTWSGWVMILALDRAALTGVGNFGVKLTIDNGFASEVAVPPALETAKAMILRWPIWISGYLVEQADDPEGPWEPIATTPSLTSTGLEMTVPVTDWHRFFRPRKP